MIHRRRLSAVEEAASRQLDMQPPRDGWIPFVLDGIREHGFLDADDLAELTDLLHRSLDDAGMMQRNFLTKDERHRARELLARMSANTKQRKRYS